VALVRVGSLPVSAINVGLAASLPGLSAKGVKLQADLTKLTPALAGQIEIGLDFPPNPISFAGAVVAALDPIELAAVVNPLNMVGASADLSVDLAVDLALVTVQLEIAERVQASLNIGLDVGGIAAWSYSGHASGFGSELERYTREGFGKTPPGAAVQAVIIATESFGSWQAFSSGAETGTSASAEADTNQALLAFLGEIPARRLNVGVADVAATIDLLVADLRGQKSGIEASIKMALGLTLPDVSATVDAGLDVFAELGIDGLLENMVNVSADLTGAIGDLTAQIDALVELTGDITAQLAAGGLMFWTYFGTAAGLGSALRQELAGGIPGGSGARAPAYGLVIAGTATSMATFGTIFKTS
jgi:hypothetical protein